TFNPDISTGTTCEDMVKEDGEFIASTTSGQFRAKSVIIATGLGIYSPVKLNICGAEKFEMSNLYYTVKDLKSFKEKDVLISGGANTAVDWAHDLSGIASSITLVCRKSELKGHEAMVDKLDKDNISVITAASIDTLIPNDDEDKISCVQLSDGTEISTDRKSTRLNS